MEAIYRLFTLRPHAHWSQLDADGQQSLLNEIGECWQQLGGELIVEHPLARQSANLTWLAFGIAGELNLTALQALMGVIAEHGWDVYIDCELPAFLHADSSVGLYYN
ncbi:hypothetical protein GC175_09955 [bacterium]|nr:hypothetical protein [bacterium]